MTRSKLVLVLSVVVLIGCDAPFGPRIVERRCDQTVEYVVSTFDLESAYRLQLEVGQLVSPSACETETYPVEHLRKEMAWLDVMVASIDEAHQIVEKERERYITHRSLEHPAPKANQK